MALELYKENNVGSLVDLSNYLFSPHDGLNGSWYTQKIWLRNDNVLYYYEGITLSIDIPAVTLPANVSANGVIYQLFPGDVEPTVAEWKHLPYHNEIAMPTIGGAGSPDVSTYYPFWLRVYSPGNSDIGRLQEASIKIKAIERAV